MSVVKNLANRLPVALASWHIVLFVATALVGDKSASDGNLLFCVDLPVSLPLVAHGDSLSLLIVGALATGWWYFIGQIGRASWEGKMSRSMSLAGALLLILMQAIAWFAMISEARLMAHDASYFTPGDVVIYFLAGTLLLGGFVSAGYAMISAFRAAPR